MDRKNLATENTESTEGSGQAFGLGKLCALCGLIQFLGRRTYRFVGLTQIDGKNYFYTMILFAARRRVNERGMEWRQRIMRFAESDGKKYFATASIFTACFRLYEGRVIR